MFSVAYLCAWSSRRNIKINEARILGAFSPINLLRKYRGRRRISGTGSIESYVAVSGSLSSASVWWSGLWLWWMPIFHRCGLFYGAKEKPKALFSSSFFLFLFFIAEIEPKWRRRCHSFGAFEFIHKRSEDCGWRRRPFRKLLFFREQHIILQLQDYFYYYMVHTSLAW